MSNLNSALLKMIGIIQMVIVSYFIRTHEIKDEVFRFTIFFIVETGIIFKLVHMWLRWKLGIQCFEIHKNKWIYKTILYLELFITLLLSI